MTSNVLIFGYKQLTDPVKLTYQAIDSFDWSDGEGKRKGYAFPSLATLARLRGVDERTLRRHLSALEEAGLLRREIRPGQPSLLWIEDPSREECERYLSTMAMSLDTDVRGRGDTDVRPLNEESEESETDKTVNGAKAFKGKGGGKRFLSAEERAKREWLVSEILNVCGDLHSLAFYRKVVEFVPMGTIMQYLSETRALSREGKLRTRNGALFTAKVLAYAADRQRSANP